jgi:hypothetical protein
MLSLFFESASRASVKGEITPISKKRQRSAAAAAAAVASSKQQQQQQQGGAGNSDLAFSFLDSFSAWLALQTRSNLN